MVIEAKEFLLPCWLLPLPSPDLPLPFGGVSLPKIFLYSSIWLSEETLEFLWKVHTHSKKNKGVLHQKSNFPLNGKFSFRPTQVLLMTLGLGFGQISSGCMCEDSIYPVESKSVSAPSHRPHRPSGPHPGLSSGQCVLQLPPGAALQLPDTPGGPAMEK